MAQQQQQQLSVTSEEQKMLVDQQKFEFDVKQFLAKHPLPTRQEIDANPIEVKTLLDTPFNYIIEGTYASPAVQGFVNLISAYHHSSVATSCILAEAKNLQIAKLNAQVQKSSCKPEAITAKIWQKNKVEFEKLKFKGQNEKRRFVEELKVKSGNSKYAYSKLFVDF